MRGNRSPRVKTATRGKDSNRREDSKQAARRGMRMTRKQAPLTALAITALATLAEEPRHPYEVFSILRSRREDRTVKLTAGTLYHAIDRLARDGLLEAVGTQREGNRPERTTYSITAAGREALERQVREMLALPAREYPQFPVAVAEASHLPAGEVRELLLARVHILESEIAELDTDIAHLRERALPHRFWLDVDYLRNFHCFERSWCLQRIVELDAGELDWNSPAPPQPPAPPQQPPLLQPAPSAQPANLVQPDDLVNQRA